MAKDQYQVAMAFDLLFSFWGIVLGPTIFGSTFTYTLISVCMYKEMDPKICYVFGVGFQWVHFHLDLVSSKFNNHFLPFKFGY